MIRPTTLPTPAVGPRRSDATAPEAPATAGFTMVEVIIAMIILTVGVLGLAGTTAYIVRQATLADLMTERAVAFQTTINRVQSMDYDAVGTGSDSVGVFEVSWSSVDDGAQNKIVTIVTSGPGLDRTSDFPVLGSAVVDSFTFRVLRR